MDHNMTVQQLALINANEKATTKKIMALEMKIKRAAVLQVRRFFYGPRCAPGLRAQAFHFCSFGTIMRWEELRRVHTWD